jgi:hypothetical protein
MYYSTKCYNILTRISGGNVRVFKTKWFARFALKEDISGKKLIDAVREAEKGLNDGELRGGLIKKRVARAGEGKRGAF